MYSRYCCSVVSSPKPSQQKIWSIIFAETDWFQRFIGSVPPEDVRKLKGSIAFRGYRARKSLKALRLRRFLTRKLNEICWILEASLVAFHLLTENKMLLILFVPRLPWKFFSWRENWVEIKLFHVILMCINSQRL